jgi:outer membrane lipoprotein-sorting protein
VDIVSVFRSRPALRWLVPSAAAVVVIGGGAALGTIVASADPALPERSAAQLLVDLQNAKVAGLSGTVVQSADLGLPPLGGAASGSDLTKLVTGSNTARVWYAGEDKARVALVGALGEQDIIRNGTDVWMWQSQQKTATHLTIPAGADKKSAARPPAELASALPSTPQEAADLALAAIDPSTKVSTTGAASVAGRSAYELVLSPRDTASLVGQVRLAIDAKEHIPLRVEVYAKGANNPAARVEFRQISFTMPDAQQFVFNPPPGTKVSEQKPDLAEHRTQSLPSTPKGPKGPAADRAGDPTVIGTGWTSVLVAQVPTEVKAGQGKDATAAPLAAVLDSLPKVSGSWGSGKLLKSTLFSALLTDDGRVLVGAAAPEKLYEAVGK